MRFVGWNFELVADMIFRRSLVACVGYAWIAHHVDIPPVSSRSIQVGTTVVLEKVNGRGRDRFVRWNI